MVFAITAASDSIVFNCTTDMPCELVQCPDDVTSCDIRCNGEYSCANNNIDCNGAEYCSVSCFNEESCYSATVNGENSQNLEVNLYSNENTGPTADDFQIFCPKPTPTNITTNETCTISCHSKFDTISQTCKGLTIFSTQGS